MFRFIAATRFRADCLRLLREVAETGDDIIVTRRGKPIARLVPFADPPTLLGSVTYRVSDDELIAPSGSDEWSALR